MGKFIISKDQTGNYRFDLKANNGEIILSSQSYTSKYNAINGINAVRLNAAQNNQFVRIVNPNNKHSFILKASNGEIIGTSGMYESASGRDNGLQSVVNTAPTATVEDSTVNTVINEAEHTILTLEDLVKQKRKQLGLTQEELAQKAGVGLRFIRELESGDKTTLRLDKVNQVLQLFGYTMGPVLLNRNSYNL